ncbi:isomerase YbhE [Penicillium waksmanii]|uniref:isomerase YbhE n=1 Tax=Penicillium waksmanii TaxID=69791 RepID=UPI0025490CCF|nr:isomerase YbhE [Penicillium waksmanii]KAJ6000749.1 isomerase YbhE [Penicillium waksmanii]
MRQSVFFLLFAALQILVTANIPPAICQQAAPNQTALHLPSVNVSVPTSPWGLAYASDDVAFVSLGAFVGVLNTSTCAPRLIRTIELPKYSIHSDGSTDDNGAAELTISKNRKEVWVSLGPGQL